MSSLRLFVLSVQEIDAPGFSSEQNALWLTDHSLSPAKYICSFWSYYGNGSCMMSASMFAIHLNAREKKKKYIHRKVCTVLTMGFRACSDTGICMKLLPLLPFWKSEQRMNSYLSGHLYLWGLHKSCVRTNYDLVRVLDTHVTPPQEDRICCYLH